LTIEDSILITEDFMFQKKFMVGMVSLFLMMSILTGCAKATPTVDPSVRITEIASTVQAELTSIALLTPSATATPEPTATPTQAPVTPTVSATTPVVTPTISPYLTTTVGDNAKWIEDVSIPDYSLVTPSSTFVKTWSVQNTGTTTWTKDYKLIYLDGLQGSNNTVTVNLTKSVAPGETVDVSVNFTAPASNGLYSSFWKMYTASGYIFGEVLTMYVNVGTSTLTPTVSATP
jgi:hypothetical protein